jgi:hypothetical protein
MRRWLSGLPLLALLLFAAPALDLRDRLLGQRTGVGRRHRRAGVAGVGAGRGTWTGTWAWGL